MKKLVVLTLLTLFIFTLNGCTKDTSSDAYNETENTDSENNETTENTDIPDTTEGTEDNETTETPEEPVVPEEPSQEDISATISSSLEDIFKSLYAGIKAEERPMTMNTPLTPDNEAYFIGATGLPYTEALASEAMISAIAHSIILLRFEEGADLEAAKEQIRTTIDPRKWICVGVEDELVVVESFENTIIVIVDDNSKTYYENFLKITNN